MNTPTKIPPFTDLEGWNALSLETLHALQVKHEELFSAMTQCVQPGAPPQVAFQLLPKALLFMGSFLELVSIADGLQRVALNTQTGASK